MESEKSVRVSVEGIVQGVGFRFFVWQHAKSRNLRGWVRNLSNGNVEVIAQGTNSDLDYLLTKLRQGPEMAQVSHLEIEWSEELKNLPEFTILTSK